MSSNKCTHEILENGLEVFLKEDHFTNIVAIQCWVRTGSLHEASHELGMAHVLEHMLFKGTAKRVVGEIAKTVEACGGNINAYTTFDRTVFYLTLNKNHASLGVELLADAIYNSSFDEEEFAREKEVILEEIRRGNDDPGSLVGRKIFEHAYFGTGAARPIIGSTESVSGFKRSDLVAFHRRWYQPKNLFVIGVGALDSSQFMSDVKQHFGSQTGVDVPSVDIGRRKFPAKRLVAVMKGDYEEPRIEVAFEAPSLHHPETPALDIATFALGGAETSRLFQRLREDAGLVTSIGASVYSPAFGGILEISATPVPDHILETVEAIGAEIAQTVHLEPVTETELRKAQASLKADRVYQKETVEGQARSLGYGVFTPYKQHFDDLYWSIVQSIEVGEIKEAINHWLDPERCILVVLVPDSFELDESAVEKAFERGVSERRAKANTPRSGRSHIAARKRVEEIRPVVMDLNAGVRLIYRHNPNAGLFGLTAATQGGLHAENLNTNGMFNVLAGMIGRATQSIGYLELQEKIDAIGASLFGFSGKDSFGWRVHCLTENVDEMLGYLADGFFNPAFPEQQWKNQIVEILEDIRTQDDSPANLAIRKFQELVFGDHPYSLPILGTKESLSQQTAASMLRAYRQYRDAGPWVFGAVGSLSPDELQRKLAAHFSTFKPNLQRRSLVQHTGAHRHKERELRVAKSREQTHIVTGYRGLGWESTMRPALEVLTTILGGQGGRFFLQLRDRESLAYSVSPIVSFGVSPAICGAYIACSPDKTDRALEGLRRELMRITEVPPSVDEMSRARAYLIGNHESDMQRGDAQAMTMALMEIYGIGHDDFLKYADSVSRVTTDDVLAAARHLFNPKMEYTVIVGQS